MDIPIIETKRLLLRKFRATDIDDMFEYASDDVVTKYLTWERYKEKSEAEKYINSIIERYNKNELAPWAIEFEDDEKMVGSIDIRYDSKNFVAEIGYVINKSYWNKGIMTEALKAVIDFGFKSLDINRIEARHDARNEASRKSNVKKWLSI